MEVFPKQEEEKYKNNRKDILEANIDYIKQHKNKYSIVELMHIVIENKINVTSENYGLLESMLHVVKTILVTLNL